MHFTQMAAFRRLIIILMAICAMLSVIAAPLQVRQQPLQALILSDDAFSDVMAMNRQAVSVANVGFTITNLQLRSQRYARSFF